jgi:hypothetical protein
MLITRHSVKPGADRLLTAACPGVRDDKYPINRAVLVCMSFGIA